MTRKIADTSKTRFFSSFYVKLNTPSASACPFKRLLDGWLNYCRADGLSQQTIYDYSDKVSRFYWWWVAETNYSTSLGQHPRFVTTDKAREFAAYLKDATLTSRWGVPVTRSLSLATVADYGRAVKVFFGFLEREGHLDKSPFNKSVKFTNRHKAGKPAIKSVNTDELTRLFATLKNPDQLKTFAGKRDLAMISLLLDSGVRKGELLSMRRIDLDTANRVFSVKGKTGPRVAHYSEVAKKPIGDYLKARLALVGNNQPDSDALWLSIDGETLSVGGFDSVIARLRHKAGVTFHVHQLRHTFALDMSHKVSVFELRDLLGHSNITTTQIYVQNNPETLSETYQRTVSPLTELEPNIPGLKRRGRPRKYQ